MKKSLLIFILGILWFGVGFGEKIQSLCVEGTSNNVCNFWNIIPDKFGKNDCVSALDFRNSTLRSEFKDREICENIYNGEYNFQLDSENQSCISTCILNGKNIENLNSSKNYINLGIKTHSKIILEDFLTIFIIIGLNYFLLQYIFLVKFSKISKKLIFIYSFLILLILLFLYSVIRISFDNNIDNQISTIGFLKM